MQNATNLTDVYKKRREKIALRQGYLGLFVRILAVAAIVYVMLSQVFLITQADGNGMFPSLKDGDLIIAFRLQSEYAKDDVVVYTAEGETRIGRIGASETDTVMLDDSGTLQVSAAGKILKNGPETVGSLPTITGFDPSTREPGQALASKDSQKDKIFQTLSEQIAKGLDCPITAVDIKDKYDIQLTFDNRIVFSMGNWSEMEYKITLAEAVLAQLPSDKVGYLSMVGDHQCSYREKDAVEKQTTAPIVTTVTDENGQLVVETDENGQPVSTTTTTETTVANDWQ